MGQQVTLRQSCMMLDRLLTFFGFIILTSKEGLFLVQVS